MAIEFGLVKFFSVEKRYGFLTIPDSDRKTEDVFFHENNGHGVHAEDGQVRFSRNTERVPRYRDAIVFERALTVHGPAALWWAYAEEYAVVLAQLF